MLTLHDFGADVLEKDRPFAYAGSAVVCGLSGTPTGGHLRKSRWRKKQPRPEDVLIFVVSHRRSFLAARLQDGPKITAYQICQTDLFLPVRIKPGPGHGDGAAGHAEPEDFSELTCQEAACLAFSRLPSLI